MQNTGIMTLQETTTTARKLCLQSWTQRRQSVLYALRPRSFRKNDHSSFLICSCVAYLYSFPESQFVSLLYFQQFPYVSHSVFQLGNIGIIETPGAVDAAADVVDICGNPADGSSQLFLLIQADFFADGSCAVWYDKTLLSLLNGHFLLKTW